MFDRSTLTHTVDDEAVADFYARVAEKLADPTPWDQLTASQQALYKELMVTAVVDDLPVMFELDPQRWKDFRSNVGHVIDVDVPLPELEATTEGDVAVARKVLRWTVTQTGVLMPQQSDLPVLLKPKQWGPTRSIVQASWLLDWLKEHGWSINLYDYRCTKRVKNNGWWFELDRFDPPEINPDTEDDTLPTHHYTLDDEAPTLPLAICRAALGAAQWMTDHPEDFPYWTASQPYIFH